MTRVPVKPDLLRWARKRAGLPREALAGRFPKLEEWEKGEVRPTLKQLEAFAKATRAPIGYFFLPAPPIEKIPIPDFRTMGSTRVRQPSPDLLDTIQLCVQRQEWYRDFARSNQEDPLPFIGSTTIRAKIVATAESMRATLGVDLEERRREKTWTDALRRLIGQSEDAGVLVMCSGVVGSNSHRRLSPSEFRGFALADDLAPVIFINGADTKAAQMFTLAHELAHLWLGQSGVSDVTADTLPSRGVERWCNQVAAEFLVPLKALRNLKSGRAPLARVQELVRHFKVSTLVILRRIHDAGWITQVQLWQAYEEELERLTNIPKSGGGNFYLTQPVRLSRRFASALVVSALAGRTLYRDAFRLLGVKRVETVHELGRSMGVPI